MEPKRAAVAATILSSFFWGSSFAVAGYGVRLADPLLSLLLRFAIAAPMALGAMALLRVPLRATLADRMVWVLGALNAVAFTMQYVALAWTTATNVALLVSMDLVFVGIASVAFLGERVTWRLASSVCLGLVGVLLVETSAGGTSLSAATLKGDLLALGAGIAWTAYIILSKMALSAENAMAPEQLTVGVCVSTAVPLLLALPLVRPAAVGELPSVLAIAVYLAAFTTILSYFLWYKGLKVLSATATSVLLLLEIAFAAALAYVFLGDRVGPGTVAGGAAICAAALVTALAPEHPSAGSGTGK